MVFGLLAGKTPDIFLAWGGVSFRSSADRRRSRLKNRFRIQGSVQMDWSVSVWPAVNLWEMDTIVKELLGSATM